MRNGYRIAPPYLPKMASREQVESREELGGLVASREGLPKKEGEARGSERVPQSSASTLYGACEVVF